jgi:hypothetical protein
MPANRSWKHSGRCGNKLFGGFVIRLVGAIQADYNHGASRYGWWARYKAGSSCFVQKILFARFSRRPFLKYPCPSAYSGVAATRLYAVFIRG